MTLGEDILMYAFIRKCIIYKLYWTCNQDAKCRQLAQTYGEALTLLAV